MDRDAKDCKIKSDFRPSLGPTDCMEGFKKNDDDQTHSKCYSNYFPNGVSCNGKLCDGECPEGWTLCEDLICMNTTECSADFDDTLTEMRRTLRDVAVDKSNDYNGRWLDLADYPAHTFNYTMCQH